MCNRVTWISDEKVTELFEELADLRGRVKSEYQRGREDASFDAESVAEPFFLSRFDPIDEDAWAVFVDILAAARGDGDCQHDWQHLKGEKCATCRRCGAARGDGEQ